jgi:hypothetical protein
MVRPRGKRVAKEVTHPAGLETMANALADRDVRGEIKLSPELRRLVKAILTNKDIGRIVEDLSRADERGAIKLSQEGIQLLEEGLASVHGEGNFIRNPRQDFESRGTEVIRGEGGRFKGRRRL